MQTIGDLFNIVIFITAAGSFYTIITLLVNRVFHFELPLWFGICGIVTYSFPILAPGLYLIPPEEHSWIFGYHIACIIWLCGMIFFAVFNIGRTFLAYKAIRSFKICGDERINGICNQCVRFVGLKKIPVVYFGTLDEPACVMGIMSPVIILNKTVMEQLADEELMTVLCHEATHLKRGHIILGRIFDLVCIINWFNPLVWIAKNDFAVHCEIDCDRAALIFLNNVISDEGYVSTMLHLLELSVVNTNNYADRMGALDFLVAKRRIELIMGRHTKAKRVILTAFLTMVLLVVTLFSIAISRGHFYPYPAHSTATEYSFTN